MGDRDFEKLVSENHALASKVTVIAVSSRLDYQSYFTQQPMSSIAAWGGFYKIYNCHVLVTGLWRQQIEYTARRRLEFN